MMKTLFRKPVFSYVIFIFIIFFTAGLILSPTVNNYFILIAVLLTVFIIFLILLIHLYDTYIKPVQKATKTVDEIVRGNYRARFHHPKDDSIGSLSNKINALGRNLGELSMQEQMYSEQLSTIIDNLESGLVLVDAKGYIHFVNRKFIMMFGKTPKDYKGYLYYDVLDSEVIHETVQNTFLYEKNVKDSFSHYRGLDHVYTEVVGAPIFNERNMLKGAVIMLYDITEMKKLELMRKDFVANVSHELKTPITSIKGFAETMLDDPANQSEPNREFLEIMYNESERIQLLIEDLLILSRLEREDFRLDKIDTDMSKVAEEVKPIIEHKAEEKNIGFYTEIQDGIRLYADKEKIKQVIINLLDNAINYTADEGRIDLRVYETEENAIIEVEDTGIGIERDAIPRIFERFYRVDKARSRNTGGTGLGLAIVKHVVELHEGKIDIISEPNKGTTMRVLLPKE
ncbi:ATP-binding protein [Virgibacillus sp. YIM 98842]|uniref:two-component system histidine kinase PnpS n=1 Tax=Virgibacillus sp. YIM 98842 TaxID=2663533 RepID=UPI001F08A2A9|nr:ATP-binding protein [Virgibacillus sp. YIM 98842]